MSNLSVSQTESPYPFLDFNSFDVCMVYLDLADIGRASKVSKSWNKLIQSSQLIWKTLFEKEGIPLVISLKEGHPRDYIADFKILYRITISGKIISQFLGKMVEQVPPISEKWFLKLKEEDPFEKGKLIGENYVFVVDPSLIVRTVDQKTPLALDTSGNLIESPKQGNELSNSNVTNQDLTIPFSLKNLKTLCSYPLKGKENMPVFNKDSINEVFNQCKYRPDKVGVYLMRKRMVEQSRRMTYVNQVALVKSHGFGLISLKVRALYDSMEILGSGTCPDDRNPLTYVRNPDEVRYGNSVCQSAIGSFAPRAGVHVSHYDYDDDYFGVVPGVPAEVLRP